MREEVRMSNREGGRKKEVRMSNREGGKEGERKGEGKDENRGMRDEHKDKKREEG